MRRPFSMAGGDAPLAAASRFSANAARARAPLALDESTIAAIVSALADELEARRSKSEGWVSVEAVARHLGVKAAWIRQHADELGVVRLGSGAKPRLRFQLRRVDELLARRTPCL